MLILLLWAHCSYPCSLLCHLEEIFRGDSYSSFKQGKPSQPSTHLRLHRDQSEAQLALCVWLSMSVPLHLYITSQWFIKYLICALFYKPSVLTEINFIMSCIMFPCCSQTFFSSLSVYLYMLRTAKPPPPPQGATAHLLCLCAGLCVYVCVFG